MVMKYNIDHFTYEKSIFRVYLFILTYIGVKLVLLV